MGMVTCQNVLVLTLNLLKMYERAECNTFSWFLEVGYTGFFCARVVRSFGSGKEDANWTAGCLCHMA